MNPARTVVWIWLLTLGLFSVVGCSTWQSHVAADFPKEKAEEAFVITERGAFRIKVSESTEATIAGQVLQAWDAPQAFPNHPMQMTEEETPDATMRRWGWKASPVGANETVSVARTEIVAGSIYHANGGRTALAVVGGVVVVAGAIFGLLLLVAAASVACGRPLRVRGKRVITPTVANPEWNHELLLQPVADAAVRQSLVEIWTEEGQAEHAAIAAFSKLSLELLALGAPPDLVARSNRSALQEVHHAKLCFSLASAYAGRTIGPAPLRQALEGDTIDLVRLARESLLDGCLREGIAQIIAERGAETAMDPEVARVLRVQAHDEAQHAELAWDIVEWCIKKGGEPVREALLDAERQARLPRCDDHPEHGRTSARTIQPYFEDLRAEARARLRGGDCKRAA